MFVFLLIVAVPASAQARRHTGRWPGGIIEIPPTSHGAAGEPGGSDDISFATVDSADGSIRITYHLQRGICPSEA